MQDICTVDPFYTEPIIQQRKELDVPWLMLKRLLTSNSKARDGSDVVNSLDVSPWNLDESEGLSSVDIFFAVFQCCDPFLKQILFQKLYMCKLAVPFLYHDFSGDIARETFALWPLRSLAIQSDMTIKIGRQKTCQNVGVFHLKSNVVSFARVGSPQYSKSKLLNNVLSDDGWQCFYNYNCQRDGVQKFICDGHVEMFWLPCVREKEQTFPDAVTFLNMRGDLQKHYSANCVSFFKKITDLMVIILEISSITNCPSDLKDLVLQWSSVVLIISGPISKQDIKGIQDFQDRVTSERADVSLNILLTHTKERLKSENTMTADVTKSISNQLKSLQTKSLESRINDAKLLNIHTDEDVLPLVQSKKRAEMILNEMRKNGTPHTWKDSVTSVHNRHSKGIGRLEKDKTRQKTVKESDKKCDEIEKERKTSIQEISNSFKVFIKNLCEIDDEVECDYFLVWLKHFIQKEQTQIPSHFVQQGQKRDRQEHESESLVTCSDEIPFSIDHFFREIGYVYDSILILKESPLNNNIPSEDAVSEAVSRLFIRGHPIELIDGESFYMPHEWLKKIFEKLSLKLGAKKVMTVSVLGLQSSGKSTLLNTMFGAQFPVKTGRCTRGIHLQLIPVSLDQGKKILSEFSYICVIDTEGLRSPELGSFEHEHDNELATVITGLGDLTLFNIMGENTTEIRDILEVIVHAFLRLKLTNKQLDMTKSCCFIHQNVADTSASQNMRSGLNTLVKTLDSMTRESANIERIPGLTKFNQVIEFDASSQVFYLKNLWQGNPPMARVNYEYSQRVVEIKQEVIQRALNMKEKSYKSLPDILQHSFDLWKGVLNENFVFSFRNCLEIKAYMEMELFYQSLSWKLEMLVLKKLVDVTFENCVDKQTLDSQAKKYKDDCKKELRDQGIEIEKKMECFFQSSRYKEIVIQWKEYPKNSLNLLCKKLENNIHEEIDKMSQKRNIEIVTVDQQSEHEGDLLLASTRVAKQYKGKNLPKKEIDSLFEREVWISFLEKNRIDTRQAKEVLPKVFIDCLYNIFRKEDEKVLKSCLERCNDLQSLPSFTSLKGSFRMANIDGNDVYGTKWKVPRKGRAEKTLNYIEGLVENTFDKFESKIERLGQHDNYIGEAHINNLLHELMDTLRDLQGQQESAETFKFQSSFFIKICVHVSLFSCHAFDRHNDSYHEKHGSKARLDAYKRQLKISFEAHIWNRKTEDTFASLICDTLAEYLREKMQSAVQLDITEFLYSEVPKVKNQLILVMLTNMVKQNDFKKFISYIGNSRLFAESWLANLCNDILFNAEKRHYFQLCKPILKSLFVKMESSVENLKRKYCKDQELPTDTFVPKFIGLLQENGIVISADSFRILSKQNQNIKDVQFMCEELNSRLEVLKTKMERDIESTSKDNVKWKDCHPVEKLIAKIWGCSKQCVFCGEPCVTNMENEGSDHYCVQHRPQCCKGTRTSGTKIAVLPSCNVEVNSDSVHKCKVFRFLCNESERKECSETHHYYRDYKRFAVGWDIPPSSDMHQTSKFWLWFVVKYKKELEEHYDYKLDEIPATWERISEEEAIQSLHQLYKVEPVSKTTGN